MTARPCASYILLSSALFIQMKSGNKTLAKEQIEVFCGGTVALIDDFKKRAGCQGRHNHGREDEGHGNAPSGQIFTAPKDES